MESDPKETNDYTTAGQPRPDSLPTDLNVPSFRKTGGVVRAVLRLYRDNFLPLSKIVAVMAVPLIIFQHVFLQPPDTMFSAVHLLALVGESLMSGALIYAVVGFLRTGRFPTLSESYGWGFRRWGKVLVCSFLYLVIVVLGCVALIIPGIIFSLMFSLVVPVAVIEDAPTMASFGRSSALTKNYRLQIFFTYFVFTIIIFAFSLVTSGVFGREIPGERSLPFALVQGLLTQLLESSGTVLTLFIYLGILRDTHRIPPQLRHDTSVPPPADYQSRPSQVETGGGF